MNTLYVVFENQFEDNSVVASFDKEDDANQCAEYLNNFKRNYKNYYVEEISLYKSFDAYKIDCSSSG